jgi:hypothetical protein
VPVPASGAWESADCDVATAETLLGMTNVYLTRLTSDEMTGCSCRGERGHEYDPCARLHRESSKEEHSGSLTNSPQASVKTLMSTWASQRGALECGTLPSPSYISIGAPRMTESPKCACTFASKRTGPEHCSTIHLSMRYVYPSRVQALKLLNCKDADVRSEP